MKFVAFLLRTIGLFLGNWRVKYLAYKDFRVVPLAGSILNRPEAISIGESFGWSANCKILCQDPWSGGYLKIGNNVKLNHNVMINADCGGRITIGNNILIGPNVVIRAANHNFSQIEKPILQQGHTPGIIVIEDDVWLGANVVVLPNVKLGKGAVVAAGSVVTKDVEPYTVVGGVPAKFIKSRLKGNENHFSK